MFDSIGRTNDADAGRRGLAAAGLSAALVAALAATLAGLAAWGVATAAAARPDEEPLVEVVLEDPGLDGLPPPPPPPPAGPAAEPDRDATPRDPDEAVATLDDPVTSEVEDAPGGAEGGVDGGVEGGVAGGVVGGALGGEVGGVIGATGSAVIHHSEVTVKRRSPFEYPKAATDLALGEVDCRVRVFLDAEGVPTDVAVDTCPVVFHDAIRASLLRWRWFPARVAGKRVPAQFLMVVRFIP